MIRTRSLALALLLVASALAADTNRIVLRVNDHILTLHDYQGRYRDRLRQLQQAQISEEERAEFMSNLGEQVFREMFDELLLLSRASHEGIDVTEAMIENAMMRMRESSGLLDDEEFEVALAQSDMTREDLRDQARRNLVLQQVTSRELQERVELDEEDLRRYYQSHLEEFAVPRRVQLRSVVILDSSDLDADGRASLAAEAAEALRAEADPELWANERSEVGETTALIDLGWVEQGDLASDLELAAWGLEAGEVSEPTASRGGLHVLQALAVEEAHIEPFVEVKDRVERLEMARLQNDAVTKMLSEFEEASFVRIDPPPEAAGFRTSRAVLDEGLGELQPAAVDTPDPDPQGAPEGSDSPD